MTEQERLELIEEIQQDIQYHECNLSLLKVQLEYLTNEAYRKAVDDDRETD